MSDEPAAAPPAWRRRWLWVAAWGLAALATYLSGVTIWSIGTAASEVPWRDQWVFLQDARAILAHDWTRLWYCYWGHRPVVARVAAALEVYWFSGRNRPVIALILLVQAGHAGLLIWIAGRLFRRFSMSVFVIVASLIIQLSFSSLQMENLIWAGQIGYILVWASATAAFFALAVYAQGGRRRSALLGGCLLSAIVSTLSVPNGLFVWPVLLLQACVLRLTIQVRALLLVAGALVLGCYFWGYQQGPPMGMGTRGALLHLERSLPIVGMLLVSPLTALSIHFAMVIGCVVLATGLYALVKVWTYRPPPLLTVYGALSLLALLTFLSLAAGRISPEFVESKVRTHSLVIPSRYYTMVFYCWDGLFGVSVWMALRNRREWPQLAISGTMMAVLTVGTISWQIGEAANWRGYYRELDVAASALITHVEDPSNRALQEIYPDAAVRSQVSTWLESNRLAVFSERRASLLGLRVSDTEVSGEPCAGQIERVVPVTGGAFRITGWVVDTNAGRATRDLVFLNRAAAIIGIARSGLRRPDLNERIDRSNIDTAGWQGYVRAPGNQAIAVYAVGGSSGHYCRLGGWVLLP